MTADLEHAAQRSSTCGLLRLSESDDKQLGPLDGHECHFPQSSSTQQHMRKFSIGENDDRRPEHLNGRNWHT